MATIRAISTIRPSPDNSLKFRKAVGQCGRAGLQDQRRFDLVQILALNSRDLRKSSPRHNTLGPEFLVAPRPDDHIRLPRDDRFSRDNTVLGSAVVPAVGENVDAASDLDKLRNPTNCEGQRIVLASMIAPTIRITLT